MQGPRRLCGAVTRKPRSTLMTSKDEPGSLWQIWVGILVGVGMVATAAVAIIETYWG